MIFHQGQATKFEQCLFGSWYIIQEITVQFWRKVYLPWLGIGPWFHILILRDVMNVIKSATLNGSRRHCDACLRLKSKKGGKTFAPHFLHLYLLLTTIIYSSTLSLRAPQTGRFSNEQQWLNCLMAKLQWKARLSRLVGNGSIGNNWFPKYCPGLLNCSGDALPVVVETSTQ